MAAMMRVRVPPVSLRREVESIQRIPSVFERDMSSRPPLVYNEVVSGCEWVINGEGVASRKWDGSACMVKDGVLYKRLRHKQGNLKPGGWIHWSMNPDQHHGHGWLPVGDGPDDKWHREGFKFLTDIAHILEGTYELVGPRIGKNPEGCNIHMLVPHGVDKFYPECPRDFEGMKVWLDGKDIEGLVWWHNDGRMAKIKSRDFGIIRPHKRKEVKQ